MTANHSDLALVLLHALPFDGRMWHAQSALLPGATYAPDLYAFGDDIQIWAQRALALTNAQRLVVVGCSVGGSCAIELARIAQDRIAALVLIGTKAHHKPDPDFLEAALHRLDTQGVKACWDKYWRSMLDRDPTTRAFAERMALQQTPQGLANGLLAFHTRPSGADVISQLDVPVHIVTGEDDLLPGVDYCKKLAGIARHSHLRVIASGGHYVPLFQSQALNVILKDVIDNAS